MAKRRSNNEGTIFKKENGTWRAQVSVSGVRKSKTTKTQKEAIEWLRLQRNLIAEGFDMRGSLVTLSEFLEDWFSSSHSSRLPETVELYERILKRNVVPVLGKVKLSDLSPNHIQKLYNHISKAGKSQHALHSIHKILNTALNQAVRLKVLNSNPCSFVEKPSRIHKEMAFLDDNQVQTLLLTAKIIKDRYFPIYYLAISTGMRQGEILGLRWEDIHWEKKTLSVHRQLIRKKGGGFIFRSPKTRSGIRPISIGPELINVLKGHKEDQDSIRSRQAGKWTEMDLVFPTYIGTPITASKLRTAFRKLLRVAGLPKTRFHDLRHTAASLMLNFGVPLIVVSKRLGHAKPSITLNEYGHLIPTMQEEAAQVMDKILTPISIPIAPKLHPNSNNLQKEE